jgi:hypothetical protein
MNLLPRIEQLKILEKNISKGVVPFRLNAAQHHYLDVVQEQLATTGRIRAIILKARQLGMSTLTEAIAFTLAFIYNDYQALVIGHKNDSSQHLLGMTKRYWDNYPFADCYVMKYASRSHLGWDTGSSMQVATAGDKEAGRSRTVHFLHASEFAFWPNAEDSVTSLWQTVPDASGTGLVIESTANGIGNAFHSQWEAAVAGQTQLHPFFFPWHTHPEYMASHIGLPYRNLGNLNDEEKVLRAIGVSDDRLAWRRYMINNKLNGNLLKFHQEYPTNPDEAFIATGMNVFPLDKLNPVYHPEEGCRGYLRRNGTKVTFESHPQGPLTVFRAPSEDTEWGDYWIGADPTNTTEGDPACAQVLNRRTLEQVAVFRDNINAGTFAEELFKLGLYFNKAMIVVEKEGPGLQTVGELKGLRYPRLYKGKKVDKTPGRLVGTTYGWSTTAQTKHLAVGHLVQAVNDQDLIIHHRETYTEMKHFIVENGEYKPADDKGHDDTVMALAIGVTTHFYSHPPQPHGTATALELPGSGSQPTSMTTDTGLIVPVRPHKPFEGFPTED